MITRATQMKWPSDRPIDSLPPAGLRDSPVARFKVFTLDTRILQRRIGRLSNDDAQSCAAALDTVVTL